MREVAKLLEEMVSAGVISNYAVFGAVAQMRYTQPVATRDADILIVLPGTTGLDILRPVHDYCRSRGFRAEGESIRVGVWLVQFIPVFNRLTEDALREAQVADFEGVPLRVVRADYLALIALDTGRKKDFMRILYMTDSGSISLEGLKPLAERHGLAEKLAQFRARYAE